MRTSFKAALLLALWHVGTCGAATSQTVPTSAADKPAATVKKNVRKKGTKAPRAPAPAKDAAGERSIDDVLAQANAYYAQRVQGRDMVFPNENMARMYRFAVTYDPISRTLFQLGAPRFESQRDMPEVVDYVLKSGWSKEAAQLTSDPVYAYSEDRALRILISSHAAANYFDISYPVLFCLVFQESQFDFKIQSPTGATGLGQLTGVAVKQVQINRQDPETEKRLQTTVAHIGKVYRDPIFNGVLTKMGFHPVFPELDKFPASLRAAQKIDEAFIRDMMAELVREGHSYGNDFNLVRRLAYQIGKGVLLPKQYAAMHNVYLQMLAQGSNTLGSTFNVETNMLFTAMLLRYYMDFPWMVDGQPVRLKPEVRTMAGVAAYNQGPAGVLRYFSQFKRKYPGKDLAAMDLNDFRETFTRTQVSAALRQPPARTSELIEHIWNIKQCAHKGIVRPAGQ